MFIGRRVLTPGGPFSLDNPRLDDGTEDSSCVRYHLYSVLYFTELPNGVHYIHKFNTRFEEAPIYCYLSSESEESDVEQKKSQGSPSVEESSAGEDEQEE